MQLQNLPLDQAAPPPLYLDHWQASSMAAFIDAFNVSEETAQTKLQALNTPLAATLHMCAARSPFLRDLLTKHHAFVCEQAARPPQQVIDALLEGLNPAFDSQMALRHALRITRQKTMLYLALADCANTLSLELLTQALSSLADKSLNAALRFELTQLAQRGQFDQDSAVPERCGLGLLGLGKLGGRELNYSSDIDLMIFFEPELFSYCGRKDKKTAAVALARATCGHLSAKTSDGFVFRVDLRLRPDPASTPIAMTLDAAETYYQSIGQTWERAALIKARHCAGDARISSDFLERIRPFVWRRHLDFAAIDDVRAMKERVHQHHQHDAALGPGPGFDVKLGHGGIREIEFFAQIHQLIMGGKRSKLQIRPTCDVLQALADDDELPQEDCARLQTAYHLLRKTEHSLQMIADAQTHTLPEDSAAAANHAQLLGYQAPELLYAAVSGKCRDVQRLFKALLQGPPGQEPPSAPAAFQDSEKLAQMRARWRSMSYRALRSARSLQLLEGVLPDLLEAFAHTPDPQETLLAFDTFISQLPAGVQLFSLLSANRALIGLLASIMGQSPELREQIGRRPAMFEGLLTGDLHDLSPPLAALTEDLDAALNRADYFEVVLDLMRIWNNEARFRTGVQLLEGLITPQAASRTYTNIAQVCVSAIYDAVCLDFSQAHGLVPGGEFVILGLGSFGAKDLVTSSDLDLTFLYRAGGSAAQSDGERPLAVREYYTRLSQRIITAITSMTGEGRLYEVDMRLRPSGRSGIIAVSLDAFIDYHRDKAWLWERMSLTKARAVAGTPSLVSAFASARTRILTQPLTAQEIRTAAWDMRARLTQAAGSTHALWPLKTGNGGLVDADFLAEGLALEHAASMQDAKDSTQWMHWWDALHRCGAVSKADYETTAQARQLLLDARIAKSLLIPKASPMTDAPRAARRKLATLLKQPDFAAVEARVQTARTHIWGALNRLLSKP